MTVQEAIDAIQIKEMQIECKATRMCEFCEGLVMAEEALEKQIPKKVVFDRFEFSCPCCNTSVIRTQIAWCDVCGQKLDWGD